MIGPCSEKGKASRATEPHTFHTNATEGSRALSQVLTYHVGDDMAPNRRWGTTDQGGTKKGSYGSSHDLKKSGDVNFIMHSIILVSFSK